MHAYAQQPPALPSSRDENWRYANLRPLAQVRLDPLPEAAPLTSLPLPPPLPGYERWVFVDGQFQPQASGVGAPSMAALVDSRAAGQEFAQLLDEDLARAGIDFALARINLQRESRVLLIRLPEQAEASLELNFVAASPGARGTSYPRVQIHAGAGSRLRLVERHLSEGASDPSVNAAVDLALSADAVVEHCRMQNCGDGASVFDTLTAQVGDRGHYRLRHITLGALTSRSTQFVRLAGRAARCELIAASVAQGAQTHDVFAQVDHVGAGTATREVFRGIATDRGKLGFNGKMIVRDTAHEADSDQSLKTLLTGTGAEAAARPQLEIYTDKVRARHGATNGKLDEQMLFYLLSRGLERSQAQALLQWAFIEDVVSQVEPPALRQEIESRVAAQLNEVRALEGLVTTP